jgi:ribosomal protein S12 methylthiotransferase accessory factor
LHLKNAAKLVTNDGYASARVRSVKDTLNEIIPLCQKIGVTRISDITHMDKLHIPNYASILPGTEDLIWVYGGKGHTKLHAKASALMEAIERYSSLISTYPKNFIQGNYFELSKSYNKVLHPDEVVEPIEPSYNDRGSITDFVEGFDLIRNEDVLVPAQLALSRYFAKPPATYMFPYSHTNGLASGNVLEEAVCHALCEVIERDTVSIADLSASSIPYSILERIADSLKKNGLHLTAPLNEFDFVDDPGIFPDVDISEIAKEFKPIRFLVERFTRAGIPLLIKEITRAGIGIPTFVASSVEWITHNYGYFAKGYGTNPDARIALIRAITEVSQTRAANIHGARDDLKPIKYKENDEIYKRKWQFMPSSSLTTKRSNIIKFSKIKTYQTENLLNDIKLILYSLKRTGLRRAIIVNLTSPKIGIPVVRAIVPGLETFEVAKLYTSSGIVMGGRAKKFYTRSVES